MRRAQHAQPSDDGVLFQLANDYNKWRARYVRHKGCMSLDVRRVSNRDDMRELRLESYRLIAQKRTLA